MKKRLKVLLILELVVTFILAILLVIGYRSVACRPSDECFPQAYKLAYVFSVVAGLIIIVTVLELIVSKRRV